MQSRRLEGRCWGVGRMLCGRKLPHLYVHQPNQSIHFADKEQTCNAIGQIKTEKVQKIRIYVQKVVHYGTMLIIEIQQRQIMNSKLYNVVDQQCNHEALKAVYHSLSICAMTFCDWCSCIFA